jgi:hypothetical protein
MPKLRKPRVNPNPEDHLEVTADGQVHALPPPPPSSVATMKHLVQSNAARARWAGEKATEQEIVELFSTIPVDEGLQILSRMRTMAETGARILNNRITADTVDTKCHHCGGHKLPNRQWALVRPYRDPKTGTLGNYYFCSARCIALENQKSQGIAAIPDRGMVRGKDASVL